MLVEHCLTTLMLAGTITFFLQNPIFLVFTESIDGTKLYDSFKKRVLPKDVLSDPRREESSEWTQVRAQIKRAHLCYV